MTLVDSFRFLERLWLVGDTGRFVRHSFHFLVVAFMLNMMRRPRSALIAVVVFCIDCFIYHCGGCLGTRFNKSTPYKKIVFHIFINYLLAGDLLVGYTFDRGR